MTANLRNGAGAVIRENLAVSIEPDARNSQERAALIGLPLSGLQPGAYTLVVDAGTARNRRPAATRQLTLWVVEE